MADQPDLTNLSNEELAAMAADLGLSISPQNAPQPVEGRQEAVAITDESVSIPAELMRGSDFEETPPEPAELGLEPDDFYQGYKILRDLPPQDERHEYLFEGENPRAFYVLHAKRPDDKGGHHDVIGLVPWLGSTVIWPWEKAWEQDLYHEKQSPERQAIMAAFIKAKKEKT